MIKYSIVLVPFDDFSNSKVRPAICLTNEIGSYDHVVIAFISSKLDSNPTQSDFIIENASEGFERTGLAVDSVIKLHRMITIPKSLIKRKLGTLPSPMQSILQNKIKALFDLD